MNLFGPEFQFVGESVGMFGNGMRPHVEGLYRYEPFRGPGHFHMQEQLRTHGSAACSYVHGGEKVSFVVLGCPEYGVLDLSAFCVEPA